MYRWICLQLYILMYSLLVLEVHCESYSLKCYFNAVSSNFTNLPLYSIVGMLDNMEIARYNSNNCKAQPHYRWMEDAGDQQFWQNITHMAQKYEMEHESSLKRIERMSNPSNDLQTYQIKFECELYDDGTIGGHTEFGYNGKDFIFFDKHELMYIPATQTAKLLTQEWNSDGSKARADKEFAEQHCVDWIKRYGKRVREEMRTKARLEVKVWGLRHPDGVTRLQCLVYGFHPRAVDVKWMKNGVDHVPSDEMTPILPHPDGTYQMRASVEVPTKEEDTYACHVEHSSLENTLIVNMIGLDSKDHKRRSLRSRTLVLPIVALLFSGLVMVIFLAFCRHNAELYCQRYCNNALQ